MWSERLAELAIDLPTPVVPLGSYIPATISGNQVLTSGQLPVAASGEVITGRLGADCDLARAQQAARLAALNALAAAAATVGGVDAITRVVRVAVFVNSTADFTDQALVANGASEILGEIFGEAGRHVRSALGMAALPKNAVVEVELVVEHR